MTAALGFLAAALSISLVWPQVWRSCRHGRTVGLSPTSAWLAVSLNACWLTFGLHKSDPRLFGLGTTGVAASLLMLTRICWVSAKRPAAARHTKRETDPAETSRPRAGQRAQLTRIR